MTNRIVLLVASTAILVIGGALFVLWRTGVVQAMIESGPEDPMKYAEISTASVEPLQMTSTSDAIKLPILVYHIVRPSYPSDSADVRALAVTPETFDQQLAYLGASGYHVVRFSDLEAYFASGTPLPSRPVILSFDDGWRDQYVYALPVLKKYRYPATFFVFTDSIGRRGFFTWDNLKEMLAAGMTIGDHSRSHPYLTRITDAHKLTNEIAGSKSILESQLGIPVNEFAYPFGMYNTQIQSLVKAAGFKSGRSDLYSGLQTRERLYELSAMNVPTTLEAFKRKF